MIYLTFLTVLRRNRINKVIGPLQDFRPIIRRHRVGAINHKNNIDWLLTSQNHGFGGWLDGGLFFFATAETAIEKAVNYIT